MQTIDFQDNNPWHFFSRLNLTTEFFSSTNLSLCGRIISKQLLETFGNTKAFSLINILGLALGLASSLLIILWVHDEYSKDAFHKNSSQLYSIYEKRYNDGQLSGGFATQGLMAGEMKRVYPEVEYATNFAFDQLSTFEANGKIIKETGNHAGEDFFKMFSYQLLEGNAESALQSRESIVISRKMAMDFFGTPEKSIGKTIRYENEKDLIITAVFENIPDNSSSQFDYLINWQLFLEKNEWANNWTNNGPLTYIMLKKGKNADAFESKISRFLDNYNKEQTSTAYIRLGIQPYKDGYLHSELKNGGFSGRIQYVRIFSIVAIFVLLIACINFMNLTTARSLKRAKEIGVRKVVGAFRSSLIKQFIGESLIVVTISAIISLLIVLLVLPYFNAVTAKQISLPYDMPFFWFTMCAMIAITGIASGSYPALYLSGFNPLRVLKGALKISYSALWLRKGLVVFQFVLSIVLIVGTIVISKQVQYIQSVHLGYDRENLIYIRFEGDLSAKYKVFKERGLQMPGVKAITRSTEKPTRVNNGTTGVDWQGKNPSLNIDFAHASVGYDYMKTLHTEMAAGRDFSKDFGTDSTGYIVNETALKIIGYTDPIGKPMTLWDNKGSIIGVVKDFHINSLHEVINPMILRLGENDDYGNALIRTEPGKTKEALKSLEKLCVELNPKFPFTYQFADEEYAKLYKSEQVIGQLSKWFAFLAIFISCLGLLGLVTFTAQQRLKEIGIRKVLGASATSVFRLLSKEFLFLVLIAMIIASPIAWFVMTGWLQDYEYRIAITWRIFVIAGLLSLMIALITISYQAIKSALVNPIKSLRNE